MSKAVILIEMPENCYECLLEHNNKCTAYGDIRVESIGKPKWCPLKTLPEKRPIKDRYSYSYQLTYDQGWNRVIEEITGEAEIIDETNRWWAEHSSRFD